MKKQFTLLFILSFCIRLSASAIHSEIVKYPVSLSSDTPGNKQKRDSTKLFAYVNYGVKLTTRLLIKDNTMLLASVNGGNNFRLPLRAIQAYSINLSISGHNAKSITIVQNVSANLSARANSPDNLKSLTSALQLDSLRSSVSEAEIRRDSVKQQIKRNEQVNITRLLKINDPDSLKNELKRPMSDTLKGLLYTRLAGLYIHYDTIAAKKKKLAYQNEAIAYTLQAIHQYARYNDSIALRTSFDNLAKVYYAQKKYVQAKWFILQSNSLSRAKNDTSNIISSLLTLSSIKSDIKDYKLAKQDLNEALQLSVNIHSLKMESQVLKNYALLYARLKNYPKEALMLKKRDSIEESILKNEEDQLTTQRTVQKRKLDSLQNKKKVYTSNIRKPYKNNSPKKIASL
ncbi:MAG TPA: hypothetical protein VIM16_23840 [Mucilaginibacter sp.]|jgi:tetratricopeptide (TPR) repeat protein